MSQARRAKGQERLENADDRAPALKKKKSKKQKRAAEQDAGPGGTLQAADIQFCDDVEMLELIEQQHQGSIDDKTRVAIAVRKMQLRRARDDEAKSTSKGRSATVSRVRASVGLGRVAQLEGRGGTALAAAVAVVSEGESSGQVRACVEEMEAVFAPAGRDLFTEDGRWRESSVSVRIAIKRACRETESPFGRDATEACERLEATM